MHIISKAPFEESARKYPNDALGLQALYRVIKVIAYINFVNKRFFVKHITNHAEYDKLTRYYRENKE